MRNEDASRRMRVLVAWGSKRGGTEGIARTIASALAADGFDVEAAPAGRVRDASAYDAAIVGGALYANRWHRDARRFVDRNVAALRRVPVWLFSSGPLDASADGAAVPPVGQVAVRLARLGARGHATFGGRLAPDAKGFPASAMARKHAGDWRNPERIRAWAGEVARVLPGARPGVAVEPPARSLRRTAAHAVAGWAACAAVMGGLLRVAPLGVALAVHAVVAPLVFTALAVHYFRAPGAREPLPTALAWTAIVALLDAGVVAGLLLRSFAMFASVAGTWLPFLLIFLATWVTGLILSMRATPLTRARI